MTNEFYEPYFKGTNFGHTNYSQIVYEGLMKAVCGYASGATVNHILLNLKYVQYGKNHFDLTVEGEKQLYEFYLNAISRTI